VKSQPHTDSVITRLREERDLLRARMQAIGLALKGEGGVGEGDYAWTPALDEARKLRALLNTPELLDFAKAVQLEAAHQRARWGSDHDAGKTDADWFWLIGYLAGKALHNPGGDPREATPPNHHRRGGGVQLARGEAGADEHAAGDRNTRRRGGLMRALSLLQPWATLWVSGAKLIETRGWGTKYRGPVAVHASARMRREDVELCFLQPFADALAALGFNQAADLPKGKVLGTVNLVDCTEMVGTPNERGVRCSCPEHTVLRSGAQITETERAFGLYEPGRFAWMTGPERTILADPIPCRGSLGLWTLPDDVAAELERRVTP
jgi:hypothetical protein